MKAIWKGTLSFGLVNIPIELFSAIQAHSFGFRLLHNKCNTPIQNERWCPACKTEVVWADIVKGLKLKDDTYFLITEQKLKELKPAKTDTIDIVEFVDIPELAPIYFNQHYYVVPAKDGQKAYFLFQSILQKMGKAAVARFIMRDKEYIASLQPYKEGLLLSTLNYRYEIKDVAAYELLKNKGEFSSSELTLAKQFVTQLSKKKFNIDQFKDTFVQKLQKKIEEAVKGKKTKKAKTTKTKKEIAPRRPGSLMTALRASLGKKQSRNLQGQA